MDTPTIAEYYREPDPMVRKKLLDKSIEAGEEMCIRDRCRGFSWNMELQWMMM